MRDASRFLATALIAAAVSVTPRAASAQIDLSGEWGSTFHEDLPHSGGMRLGDFTGLPLAPAPCEAGNTRGTR